MAAGLIPAALDRRASPRIRKDCARGRNAISSIVDVNHGWCHVLSRESPNEQVQFARQGREVDFSGSLYRKTDFSG